MMSNVKSVIDEWSVRDLEDGSALNISVYGCSELGNSAVPGIQVCYMGQTVNYEPLIAERWAYLAGKAEKTEWLIEDQSWTVHEDQYVRNYLVIGTPLKARVEVKTRSSRPAVKDYELPFSLDL